ncbi:hypothetical protein PORCRE_757 [Porphyromonas crevioricanis JCM 15906]|uniref:MmcQ-like protein n=1 Tax=Porphyromonas crevioricanis JCM 15906 TaxID=1305617 RepID=T1DRY8_9PORP|nr:MmcQ/YjbR family DNA-binding protein [Porphyromonas crevioricanis]GAD05059.1 hypothetical protein PORCRE_757 [Porphyromonas crevioricanis JCM 15906]SJZ97277.1 Predicted DNA-binding protein, MmcQ/YjbR family [Porphyromonas crevioricanis]
MNTLQAEEYCLSFPLATEDMPFDEDVLVFRVSGKIFALTSLSARPMRISLKCDPDLAIRLREKYRAVEPAYHMNKKHWNQIALQSDLSDEQICKLIHHSYCLIIKKLPASVRKVEPLASVCDELIEEW